MRPPLDKERLLEFLKAFGENTQGSGRIYLTGGATALLHGWREMTIDVDIKADPEPGNFFESIAKLKDELGVNIELAAPDQFIPSLPGWRERSLFIDRFGDLDVYHYDPYSQALAKLERGHPRDLDDVESMHREGLVQTDRLEELFENIRERLIEYPSIEADIFADIVEDWCRKYA